MKNPISLGELIARLQTLEAQVGPDLPVAYTGLDDYMMPTLLEVRGVDFEGDYVLLEGA